jgi:hypothetical protein
MFTLRDRQPSALAVMRLIISSELRRLLHRKVSRLGPCKRPNVLTPEERALVFAYCSGHVVARCAICDVSFRYTELATDILGGSRTNMCPRCRQDLTEAVRAHLFRCAMLPSEVRLRALAVREAAQRRMNLHQAENRQTRLPKTAADWDGCVGS